MGAVFISTTGEHNIIQNCEVTNSPMCIHVYGQHNLITRDYIHDLNDMPKRGWWSVGLMICNSNNEVSYNKIVNCRKESPRFGWDGGAIELDDRNFPRDNISIHHNITWDNQGFLEIVESSVSCKNLYIAYNVADNYQCFVRLSTTELENCGVETGIGVACERLQSRENRGRVIWRKCLIHSRVWRAQQDSNLRHPDS